MTPRQRRREQKRQNRIAAGLRKFDQRALAYARSLYGRMQRLVTWMLLAPLLLLLAVVAGPGAAVQGTSALAVNMWANYKPHTKQIQFHKSKARFKVLLAGRRSGKTYAAAREFVRRILQDHARAAKVGRIWDPGDRDEQTGEPKPLLHYWAVAPSHPIGKVQRREVFDVLKGKKLVASYVRTRGELWLHGGILVEFKSAEDPDSLVGAGLHGMWIDEAARLKPDAWTGNLQPTLADNQGWGLFSTTPLGRNWFDEEIVRRADPEDIIKDPDYDLFQFTSLDNTTKPGLAEEVEKAKTRLPRRYFLREYMASRDAFAGQIYDEFSRSTHVVPLQKAPFYDADPAKMAAKAKKHFVKFVIGKDWGFSEGHPGVSVLFGITRPRDPKDPTSVEFWALEEIYEHTWRTLNWIEADRALVKRYGVAQIWAPHDRPDLVKEYRLAGLPIKQGAVNVAPGIEAMATLIHYEADDKGKVITQPRFFVLDRAQGAGRTDYRGCPNLIRETSGYRWAVNSDGSARAEEKPLKQDDHAPDAARVAVFNEIGKKSIGPIDKPAGA